jgi:hypothetical protein
VRTFSATSTGANRGGGQAVRRRGGQGDGDEAAHAVPVSADPLPVHVRQALQNLHALQRAAHVLFTCAEGAAPGGLVARPPSRPQRTAVVRVVGCDAHQTPADQVAGFAKPEAPGTAAQAMTDEDGRKRPVPFRLQKDAFDHELLVLVGPLDAVELEAG